MSLRSLRVASGMGGPFDSAKETLGEGGQYSLGHILYLLLNTDALLNWGQKEREGNMLRTESH